MTGPGDAIRLDKWLWHARVFRSRGLAARTVAAGVVRVNAVRVTKTATAVRIGDGLTFPQAGTIRILRIRSLGHRRGPPAEARLLYEDLGRPGPVAPTRPVGLEPSGEADT